MFRVYVLGSMAVRRELKASGRLGRLEDVGLRV